MKIFLTLTLISITFFLMRFLNLLKIIKKTFKNLSACVIRINMFLLIIHAPTKKSQAGP